MKLILSVFLIISVLVRTIGSERLAVSVCMQQKKMSYNRKTTVKTVYCLVNKKEMKEQQDNPLLLKQ